MNRLKLIAGVLLILLTGIAAGHLGTVFYFKNKIYNQGPPALHHLIKKKIIHKLRLTKPQQIKFDKILTQTEEGFNTFRQKHHPEVELILTDCFGKINEILTPEQQKRFEKIKNRFKRRFHGAKEFSPQQPFGKRLFARTDELKDQLSLTENQIKNIEPIIHQFNRDIKTIFMNHRVPDLVPMTDHDQDTRNPKSLRDKNTLRDEINQVENDMIAQIKHYLNDKQIIKFQKIIKEPRPYHADKR